MENLSDQLNNFRERFPVQRWRVADLEWTGYRGGERGRPVVLLLAGAGGDAEAMFPYIDLLTGYFDVIAPNLPPVVRDVQQAVDCLYALLEQLRVTRWHLVGIAFGALLAQVMVRRYPQQIMNLVITHSVAPSDQLIEPIAMQRRLLACIPAPLLMWNSRRTFRAALQHSLTPAPLENRRFWQDYFDLLYRQRIGKAHLIARAGLALDYHRTVRFTLRDLADWRGRLLLIESDADEVIGEGERGTLQAFYPQAYLQTLVGCDHLAPLLAADQVAQSILRFLTDEPAAGDPSAIT
jgi:pimeloyl-ACP methyl ester carboxylesterase